MAAIGIDMGSTMATIAVCEDNRVTVVPNDQGNVATPCAVGFWDRSMLVGGAVTGQVMARRPLSVIESPRVLLGKGPGHASVRKYNAHATSKAVEVDGRLMICVDNDGEMLLSPEEVLGFLFTHLKENVQNYLGYEVQQAVITVPMYFDDAERNAVKDAASRAGIRCLRLLNDPTAALYAHGLETAPEGTLVLVVDVGGESLDVTLLGVEDGIVESRATSGSFSAGTGAFTNRLVDLLLKKFEIAHGVQIREHRALHRLRAGCERARRNLCSSAQAAVEIDSFYGEDDLMMSVSREDLESSCKDLLEICRDCVLKVLSSASVPGAAVTHTLLVGGGGDMPAVKQAVEDALLKAIVSVRPVCSTVSVAMAVGAALAARRLLSRRVDDMEQVTALTHGLPPALLEIASAEDGDTTACAAIV